MRAPVSAAFCVLVLRSTHLPGDHCQEARESYQGDLCGDCGVEVLTVQDAVPQDERRWLHIQHALLACHACSDRRPSPRQLREALLSVAYEHAATLVAVADAFPLSEADPSVLRECGVLYILDPVQSCPGPRVVRLMHVALIAAYIEPVAADFCGRAADPVRLAALRLPTNSCLRNFFPPSAPPPPPVLGDLSHPALGSLRMRAQVPLLGTCRVDFADNVCLGSSALVQPLLPSSVLAPVSCGCASALRASSVLSLDNEIWLCDDPRPSSPPVFTSVCSAPVGAEADGPHHPPPSSRIATESLVSGQRMSKTQDVKVFPSKRKRGRILAAPFTYLMPKNLWHGSQLIFLSTLPQDKHNKKKNSQTSQPVTGNGQVRSILWDGAPCAQQCATLIALPNFRRSAWN